MSESISSQDLEFVDVPGKEPFQINRVGQLRNKRTGKVLKIRLNAAGYPHAGTTVDGKYLNATVHRCIALVFIPNPENKPYVNHIDGDKTNHSLSNLEWCTCRENTIHAFETGLRESPKGSEHYASVHSEETIHNICKDLESGMKNSQVMEKYGVGRWLPSEIRLGEKWKHISSQYNLERANRKVLDKDLLKEICDRLSTTTTSYKALSEEYGIPEYRFVRLVQKKIYKSFVKDYDFSIRFNDYRNTPA